MAAPAARNPTLINYLRNKLGLAAIRTFVVSSNKALTANQGRANPVLDEDDPAASLADARMLAEYVLLAADLRSAVVIEPRPVGLAAWSMRISRGGQLGV